jgi:ABC-2 type transport system permease protein
MKSLRLIASFVRASLQQDLAYRSNFLIGLLHSLLNLAVGFLGVYVLFGQVDSLQGWDFAGALAILGVYLTVSALRGLFIGPSLDALVGIEGEVLLGKFDYTLLRPVNTQFLASLRHWRLFALIDLAFGMGVLVTALAGSGQELSATRLVVFAAALLAGVVTLYAILLAFTALVFWSPGMMFTWIFDGIFQMARYPVGIYPGWLRLVLTWIVPVGVVTTIPAQALMGGLSPAVLLASLGLAVAAVLGASVLFRRALRRYASASS